MKDKNVTLEINRTDFDKLVSITHSYFNLGIHSNNNENENIKRINQRQDFMKRVFGVTPMLDGFEQQFINKGE